MIDYKKKYEEALEKAKTFKAEGKCFQPEDIFSELRETEDERCRVGILKFLKCILSMQGTLSANDLSQEDFNRWFTWLENQKSTEWSDDDETYISDALWCVEQARKIAKDENDMGTTWCAERWLKSLKPRSNWKPSKGYIDALEFFINYCDKDLIKSSYSASLGVLHSLLSDLKKL